DLRDDSERERHGIIPGSLHVPYAEVNENVSPGGLLNELVRATNKR
ncbi:MAG: MBL fold metallo-hydrolase, partial [Gammaproteobacteria bacterium]|nr:MBL fold metallo-hydrolase [Gammaproteobacteria bacterium]